MSRVQVDALDHKRIVEGAINFLGDKKFMDLFEQYVLYIHTYMCIHSIADTGNYKWQLNGTRSQTISNFQSDGLPNEHGSETGVDLCQTLGRRKQDRIKWVCDVSATFLFKPSASKGLITAYDSGELEGMPS